MRIICFIFSLLLSLPVFAEVSVMPMSQNKKAQSGVPAQKPVLPAEDDEMLSAREIREFIKYTVCGVRTVEYLERKETDPKDTGVQEDKKYTIKERFRQPVCAVYYAPSGTAGKAFALNSAHKDYPDITDIHIKDMTAVQSNKDDFNLKDKTPVAVTSFNAAGIYKKVLTSPKKIKMLYNYADLPLAWKIAEIIDKRSNNDLPLRITFYEDTSAQNPPAYAVIVFKAEGRSGALSGSTILSADAVSSASDQSAQSGKSKTGKDESVKSKPGVTVIPLPEEKYIEPLTDTEPNLPTIYDLHPDQAYLYR